MTEFSVLLIVSISIIILSLLMIGYFFLKRSDYQDNEKLILFSVLFLIIILLIAILLGIARDM